MREERVPGPVQMLPTLLAVLLAVRMLAVRMLPGRQVCTRG